MISIHAPLAGGDLRGDFNALRGELISIHAPLAGGDVGTPADLPGRQYFNPRPPRGGRPKCFDDRSLLQRFQSTPPSRGATLDISSRPSYPAFQSTPPSRGATCPLAFLPPFIAISIHAPLAGGDRLAQVKTAWCYYFNPRPPRGGRRLCWPGWMRAIGFQSTPPSRGATCPPQVHSQRQQISIHAPLAGGDGFLAAAVSQLMDFNPRPPRGGRPQHVVSADK